ncbi:MAG: hypothetical protein ACOYL6_07180 [Bacteriovoracaceae bacterium]
MKLVTLLVLLLSHSLFAADLSEIHNLSNRKIETLKKDFAEMAKNSKGTGYKGEVFAFKINVRLDDETIETTIEQMITEKRSKKQYSIPDTVSVNKIKKGDETSVFEAIVAKLTFELMRMKTANDHFDLVKPTRQVVYFESEDSNSFGACQDIVIFDIKNQEVLFLGACYTE